MISAGVGSAALYIQKSTEPPPIERSTEAKGHVFSNPGIFTIIIVNVFLGVNFGAIDVIAVAFSDEQGVKSLAGFLLSAFALGSLISGAIYGARNWNSATHHRFGVTVSLLAIGTCTMPLLARDMVTFGLILFIVGFTIAPSLVGANSVIQRLAPPRALTEAFAWLGTSLGFGVAFGSAIAGNLIDHYGAHTAMLLPAGCAVLGAILALSRSRRSTRRGRATRSASRRTAAGPASRSEGRRAGLGDRPGDLLVTAPRWRDNHWSLRRGGAAEISPAASAE